MMKNVCSFIAKCGTMAADGKTKNGMRYNFFVGLEPNENGMCNYYAALNEKDDNGDAEQQRRNLLMSLSGGKSKLKSPRMINANKGRQKK